VYAVYQDHNGKLRAVKRDFTTLGFFFTWIWALFRGLIGIAFTILITGLLAGILIPISIFQLALSIAIMLAVGTQGNEWIESEWLRRDYKFLKLENGKSRKKVISNIIKQRELNPEHN
jgi:hypothetical protein